MMWGMKDDRLLQDIWGVHGLQPGYADVSDQTKHKEIHEMVREAVVRNSSVGAHVIQQMCLVRQLQQVISEGCGEELCNISTAA